MPRYTPPKLANAALTKELKRLASEVHTTLDDGTPITREQALAEMIWKMALGWEEITRDENGSLKKVKHPPVAWCQQFLFERIEGRAPQATPEESSRIKASDKVRELAVERINKLAAASAGPPKYTPKGEK